MDKVVKIALAHFEKALIVIFSLALLYSLIWHGPFVGRTDIDAKIGAIKNAVQSQPVVNEAPKVEALIPQFLSAGVAAAQGPVTRKIIYPWPDPPSGPKVMGPGTDASSSRGYIKVQFSQAKDQPSDSSINFLGLEVMRAVVTGEGPGEFETITKSGDRTYMTFGEIYDRAKSIDPNLLDIRPNSSKSGTASKRRMSVRDLLNDFHDGKINESQLSMKVADGAAKGLYTAQDAQTVRRVLSRLRTDMPDVAQSMKGSSDKPVGAEDVKRKMLENWGYPGNQAAAVAETAGGGGPSVPRVTVDDIDLFVDGDVNPDLEYSYKCRYVTEDTSGVKPRQLNGQWSEETPPLAPKPDTEFYLMGGRPGQGSPSILVRKWVPSRNAWVSKTYPVTAGEQIGRIETLPVQDAQGSTVVEGGQPKTETVNFSTNCILLEFRMMPRAFEKSGGNPAAGANSGPASTVDNADYVLYDTPQIIYSNRKGQIRMKWKTLADVK